MYNHVCFEALLTAPPILGKTERGKSCCTFVAACYKDGYGRGADFIKCKAWGKVAEALCETKLRGDHLLIDGALIGNQYENYMGKEVRELIVSVRIVKFLPKEPKARFSDEFFETFPEIKKLYNKFVKDNGYKDKFVEKETELEQLKQQEQKTEQEEENENESDR